MIRWTALVQMWKWLGRNWQTKEWAESFPAVPIDNIHFEQVIGSVYEVTMNIIMVTVVRVAKFFTVICCRFIKQHTPLNGDVLFT